MAKPAIIFDLDGTLIHSAPQIHAVANEVLSEEGLDSLTHDQVQGFVGNGLPTLVARILSHLGCDPAGAQHGRMVARFHGIYEQRFEKTSLYPGVDAMLQALADHPLGICTNKPLGPTHAVLRHFGLAQHFAVVIGGDSLAQRKPDPAPLLAAVQALGSGPAIFVGDSEVDAETAARAGIPLALYTLGYRHAAAESLGATWLFDHHSALPDLIRGNS